MNRVGLKFDASDVDSVLVQLGLHHAGFFLATNDNKITSSGTLDKERKNRNTSRQNVYRVRSRSD